MNAIANSPNSLDLEGNISSLIKVIWLFTKENFRMGRFMGMEQLISQPQFSIEGNFSLVKDME